MRSLCVSLLLASLAVTSVRANAGAGMRALEELRQRAEDIRKERGSWRQLDEVRREIDDLVEQLGDRLAEDLRVTLHNTKNEGVVLDDVLNQVLVAHASDWQVLARAAEVIQSRESSGTYTRKHGIMVRLNERGEFEDYSLHDRFCSIRLYLAAEQRIPDDAVPEQHARFYREFAEIVAESRMWRGGYRSTNEGADWLAWGWLLLTDLSQLPDPHDSSMYFPPGYGHPVDDKGEPVYFRLPESWQAAKNDGERWRWLKQRQMEVDPDWAAWVTLDLADRWRMFYGTSTLPEELAAWLRELDEGAAPVLPGNIGALHELGENETVCKLANGIRRFELPEEFRFIGMHRHLAGLKGGNVPFVASERLADVFTKRAQHDKAAEMWRTAIAHLGNPVDRDNGRKLEQITGNLGRFDPQGTQPAGRCAQLGFVFRNAKLARFTARPVDIEGLINAAGDYLESDPHDFVLWKTELEWFGDMLVPQPEWLKDRGDYYQDFLGEISHEWVVELEPAADHRDRRVMVETPIDQAGAWLVQAELLDGNVSTILLWIADTALMRKPSPGGMMYLVRDARDGSPVVGAEIELVGYSSKRWDAQRHEPLPAEQRSTKVRRHLLTTDEEGCAFLSLEGPGRDDLRLEWLAVVRTADGRMAHLGFEHLGSMRRTGGPSDRRSAAYVVSDRPVYRAGQEVQMKVWLSTSMEADGETDGTEKADYSLHVVDPARREVWHTDITTNDGNDGALANFTLPENASPGVWRIELRQGEPRSSRSFLVEEEHAPAFRINVEVPTEPVRLGDAFEALVRVHDHAGAPVSDATVRYKVSRYHHYNDWAPPGPWDWLYGEGYGLLAPTVEWHPRYRYRGSESPQSVLFTFVDPDQKRPELVTEGVSKTGPDGTLMIGVDSALAKLLHGDSDHLYTVSVLVADDWGRTALGSGSSSVIAARQPFDVRVVPDCGFYEAEDRAFFTIHARSADGRPVAGSGVLKLLRQDYDAAGDLREEREVGRSAFALDGGELSRIELPMADSGHYRVVASLTSSAGDESEGGVFLVVLGEGEESGNYRFNPLEVIPEKPLYRPGETVRLLINSSRTDALVEVYVRPERAGYERPVMLQLQGRSGVFELPLEEHDQPNLFVEAVLVDDAKVHSVVRRIAVPPVERILHVQVEPLANEVQPGGRMEVSLRLTDANGEPVQGEVAVAVYDRALESVAGDTRAADIRTRFLRGLRYYKPFLRNSLARPTWNVYPTDTTRLTMLGGTGLAPAPDDRDRFVPGGAQRNWGFAGKVPPHEIRAADAAARAQPFEVPAHGHFAGSAFWNGSLVTDENGWANVEFNVPEQAAQWIIHTWAVAGNGAVGYGAAQFRSAATP